MCIKVVITIILDVQRNGSGKRAKKLTRMNHHRMSKRETIVEYHCDGTHPKLKNTRTSTIQFDFAVYPNTLELHIQHTFITYEE